MKKLLLSASIALLSVSGAVAGVDPAVYAPVNGINVTNLWVHSLKANEDEFKTTAISKAAAKARTAVTYDGVIYVGNSVNDDPTIVDDKGAAVDCAGIEMYSVEDGAYLGKLKVTLDGTRISGLLCANQVGVDDFGNLWMAGYSASKASKYKIYTVDKVTGAATLQAELDRDLDGRIDYSDLVGDITRVNAKCIVMAAGALTAYVYRWESQQGNAEWEGGFDGDTQVKADVMFPAQTLWGTAPTVTIVNGEDEDTAFDAQLFYVDGYTTNPSLYDYSMSMVENFGSAPDLAPKVGTNGIAEFVFDGRNFIAYSWDDYYEAVAGGCNINICELGAAMSFTGMTKYWTLPENGLGELSDTGTRVHSIGALYTEDAVLISTFKCMNGLGVYKITKGSGVNDATIGSDVKITSNGTVITVSEEASEIAIFNIAGQLVNKVNNATEIVAPAAGAYIVKATVAGSTVAKKVVL